MASNQGVAGSSPAGRTIKNGHVSGPFFASGRTRTGGGRGTEVPRCRKVWENRRFPKSETSAGRTIKNGHVSGPFFASGRTRTGGGREIVGYNETVFCIGLFSSTLQDKKYPCVKSYLSRPSIEL